VENVAVRSVTGGPAPDGVLRSVQTSVQRLAADQAWWREQREKLATARRRLDSAAAELAGIGAKTRPAQP
jgi:hypothetical protein